MKMDQFTESEQAQQDDSYWDQTTSTSTFLDTPFQNNNLWEGLFSPADGPRNFFELNNDFIKQLPINASDEKVENDSSNIVDQTGLKTNSSDNSIPDIFTHSATTKEPSTNGLHQENSPAKKRSTSSHQSQSSSKLTTFTNSAISNCTRESTTSLDDANSQASDVTSVHLDYARLRAEHRKLRKYFENAYECRYKTPPIAETIRRLGRCEPVTLDFYRSKQEKLDLLDGALEFDDWDVVVTVLLFLKRTLSNSLFRQCLLENPAAAKHYVSYLNESGDKQELMDTLYGLGRIADATMLEFEQACRQKDPKQKLEALRNCLISGFHHPDLSNEKRHLQEWINLLETHTKSHLK